MSFELEKVTGLYLCKPGDGASIHALRNGDFRIGRAQDNDLTVSDRTVSAYHANIYTYLTASYIEDLDSTNGTFVNGKRIRRHVLKAGDVIRLGAYELTLQAPAASTDTLEASKAAM